MWKSPARGSARCGSPQLEEVSEGDVQIRGSTLYGLEKLNLDIDRVKT